MKSEFVAYEYKDVLISKEKLDTYLECVKHFGWQVVSQSSSLTNVNIKLRRNHNMKNREQIITLEKELEDNFKLIEKLEHSKNDAGVSISLVIGLIATAFIAGAVFSYLAGLILLMIILAIPGFIGWILPYFVFKRLKENKIKEVVPTINNSYDKIYEISEKAFKIREEN